MYPVWLTDVFSTVFAKGWSSVFTEEEDISGFDGINNNIC